jgi:hypothetical protein
MRGHSTLEGTLDLLLELSCGSFIECLGVGAVRGGDDCVKELGNLEVVAADNASTAFIEKATFDGAQKNQHHYSFSWIKVSIITQHYLGPNQSENH